MDNTKKCKFSILMPVYNVEKYVAKSIESVLNQTFEDWELIVIDDGSSDTSGRIIETYSNLYDRIHVYSQDNHGLLYTRRKGIELAKGEYIVFLDSDDFLEDTCLERIEKCLSKNNNIDIVLYCGYLYQNDERIIEIPFLFKPGIVNKDDIIDIFISSDNVNAIWLKATKASLLKMDDTDYDQFFDNSYGEDKLQFLFPLTKANTIYYLDARLYYYRYNPESLTRKITIESIRKKLHPEVWTMLIEYMKKWDRFSREDQRTMGEYYYRYMIGIFSTSYASEDARQRKEAVKFMWKEYIPDFLKSFRIVNRLSIKERLKLFIMMNNIDILRGRHFRK